MTNILIVLMLTVCSGTDQSNCHEFAQEVWQAESTNALSIALEQCDAKASSVALESPNAYVRCVIEAEND